MPDLVGRDQEPELIASFLKRAAADGATLLFTGEPGIGKTALLDAAAEAALAADLEVVRAAGSEFGTQASFSGLAQLLQPLAAGLPSLSSLHRRSLAALAAPGDQARGLFETALATPGADQWPFDLARVRLLYGEWLRRERSTAEARVQLSMAMNTFRQLGALPWQVKAANELRAAGLAVSAAEPAWPRTLAAPGMPEAAPLTPLDRQIAELAAAGLTNKQIGERLYLSHRTVAAHLYQIFPRLGITSRAALRDALDALDGPEHDE